MLVAREVYNLDEPMRRVARHGFHGGDKAPGAGDGFDEESYGGKRLSAPDHPRELGPIRKAIVVNPQEGEQVPGALGGEERGCLGGQPKPFSSFLQQAERSQGVQKLVERPGVAADDSG
jgi:hypothetical protein